MKSDWIILSLLAATAVTAATGTNGMMGLVLCAAWGIVSWIGAIAKASSGRGRAALRIPYHNLAVFTVLALAFVVAVLFAQTAAQTHAEGAGFFMMFVLIMFVPMFGMGWWLLLRQVERRHPVRGWVYFTVQFLMFPAVPFLPMFLLPLSSFQSYQSKVYPYLFSVAPFLVPFIAYAVDIAEARWKPMKPSSG